MNSKFYCYDSNFSGSSDIQWCFSQVKGTLDDDVTEGSSNSDKKLQQEKYELLAINFTVYSFS